ncbi:MAG: hypothetical protein FJ116_02255 [Deltaproteobacteria bacterium]|nr:hypothetical protein [Deltaproteobacteria bacterium]
MAENYQKMDVRTYSRYVEKGLLKDADVRSHLKGLIDDTDNAVWVDVTAEEVEVSAGPSEDELETSDTKEEVLDSQAHSTEEGA